MVHLQWSAAQIAPLRTGVSQPGCVLPPFRSLREGKWKFPPLGSISVRFAHFLCAFLTHRSFIWVFFSAVLSLSLPLSSVSLCLPLFSLWQSSWASRPLNWVIVFNSIKIIAFIVATDAKWLLPRPSHSSLLPRICIYTSHIFAYHDKFKYFELQPLLPFVSVKCICICIWHEISTAVAFTSF